MESVNDNNTSITVGSILLLAISLPGCKAPPRKRVPPRQRIAALERLEPSDSLLTPPAGVTGDFAVASQAPAIDFGVLPGQWADAKLWSAWGDAVFASDGKFYASIGDHDHPHGHTCVYAIDPASKMMELIVDVNEILARPEDKYAPGKIHAPLIDPSDGWLYFVTYRGSVRSTTQELGYEGDWLVRYHLASGKIENLGIMVPHASVPVLACHAGSKTLYGLAAPGRTMPRARNKFFVYDLQKRELIFDGGPESTLNRALILAEDGRAYYDASGVLVRYDPKDMIVTPTPACLPGDGTLRAASRPDANGVAYGITRDGVVFAFDTKAEKIAPLVDAFVAGPLYTAVCELDPTGRYLYYVPSAHGRSRDHGTAVIQLDVTTKQRKVIAFLNATLREGRNYNLGGTYAVALNQDGSQLFICWNGGPADKAKSDFGLCSAMILDIPEGERGGARTP